MILAGASVLVLFVWWENRRIKHGPGALIDPAILRSLHQRNGVMSFFFLFLIQAGIFFTVPLILSVALEISAVQTGVRLLPLSLSLLLFASSPLRGVSPGRRPAGDEAADDRRDHGYEVDLPD